MDCSAKEVDTASGIINSIPIEVIENKGDPCHEAAYYHSFVGKLVHLNHMESITIDLDRLHHGFSW